jgi:ribose/xylose/arabinose/galactoside ABC-type transport system permease subunit
MTAPQEIALERPRRRLPRLQELGLVIVIVLLYLPLSVAGFRLAPEGTWNLFLSADNQFNGIGTSMSIYAIMAMGMTAVVVAGGIDISVGSIMGFCALASASVLQKMPIDAAWYVVLPTAFAVSMGVGAFWGLVNGGLTVGLRMHPFIVTLGTMSIIRGLCFLWFPSNVPIPGSALPTSFKAAMRHVFFGNVELAPVIVMIVVILAGAVFLHLMVAGRETYAVGGNAEAARFSGIRVGWVTLRVYLLMGVCCGIAAVVQLGRFGTGRTGLGEGDELMVIAAAVVGGASLTGGRGTALGALLGALVIAVIVNGISVLSWPQENTKVIVGIAIITAVAVDRFSIFLSRRVRKV